MPLRKIIQSGAVEKSATVQKIFFALCMPYYTGKINKRLRNVSYAIYCKREELYITTLCFAFVNINGYIIAMLNAFADGYLKEVLTNVSNEINTFDNAENNGSINS
uniref:Uncharacterized protein n=1 Tax=Glossina austeni TaxID=7395 RepID=A0A1A9UWN7_GLOAU